MTFPRFHIPLSDAAAHIRDGDLLQFRPRKWRLGEQLTAIAGRGEYCHSALAAWWGDTLMLIEARLHGIRAVTLRSQVRRFPELIDVYETNRGEVFPNFTRAAMLAAMREKTGREYGLRLLLRTTLTHTLLARLIVRACVADNGHDMDHRGPEFCSQAIASAARIAGGEDPVSALSDRSTEPSDLTRSALFNHNSAAYRFTLTP